MTRVSLRTFPSPPPAPRPASGKELHPVARLPEEWRPFLAELGEPAFRADQIYRWIHAQGVFEPERMSNLSRTLRARLGELNLACPLTEETVRRSSDGTRKLLLRLMAPLALLGMSAAKVRGAKWRLLDERAGKAVRSQHCSLLSNRGSC